MKSNKTCRILCLFDIFYTGEIISFSYIFGIMKNCGFQVSKKTIYRDIQLLKKARILQVCYSQKQKAYIPAGGDYMHGFCIGDCSVPELPENKKQRLYIKRIIRLCRIMVDVMREEIQDPLGWYRRNKVLDNLSPGVQKIVVEDIEYMGSVRFIDVSASKQKMLAILVNLIKDGEINGDNYSHFTLVMQMMEKGLA